MERLRLGIEGLVFLAETVEQRCDAGRNLVLGRDHHTSRGRRSRRIGLG